METKKQEIFSLNINALAIIPIKISFLQKTCDFPGYPPTKILEPPLVLVPSVLKETQKFDIRL